MKINVVESPDGLTATQFASMPDRIRSRIASSTNDAGRRALEHDLPLWESASSMVSGKPGTWMIDWDGYYADDTTPVLTTTDTVTITTTGTSLREADVLFTEIGKRNSAADMAHIQAAHDKMCSLGAKCDMANTGDAKKMQGPEEPLVEVDDGEPEDIRFGEAGSMGYEAVTLAEAGALFDDATRTVTIIPIRPGFGNRRDRFYYPEKVLREAVEGGLFNGRKMYANHPKKSDEKDRPERDVRDWVGVIKETRWDADRRVPLSELQVLDDDVYRKWKAAPDHVSYSVLGNGSARSGRVDGKDARIVEAVSGIRSVDWVTEAGAGGAIFAESGEGADEMDWNTITADDLRENRPDLIVALREDDEEVEDEVVDAASDPEDTDVAGFVPEGYVTREEFDALRASFVNLQVKEAVANGRVVAHDIAESMVREATLPRAARDFVTAEFAEASVGEGLTYDDPDMFREAVAAKIKSVKAVTDTLVGRRSRVQGLGASTDIVEPKTRQVEVRESVEAVLNERMGVVDISEAPTGSARGDAANKVEKSLSSLI